jgi:hypothetical protein
MRCGEHGGGHDIGAEALEGGGPRRGGSAAALPYSSEQSRTTESREGEIRKRGRLVTSREDSKILERWQRHGKGSGRWRQRCRRAEGVPVSAGREKQRWRGKLKGVPYRRCRSKTHQGNGHGEDSTTTTKQAQDHGSRRRCLLWRAHGVGRGRELCGCASEGGE